MCRNHSHLIARYVGEYTAFQVPVLTFQLGENIISIEGPKPSHSALMLKTSGVLYLPAYVPDGSVRAASLPMGGASMSLCLLPGNALTIMRTMQHAFQLCFEQSGIQWNGMEYPPTPPSGEVDDQDTAPLL